MIRIIEMNPPHEMRATCVCGAEIGYKREDVITDETVPYIICPNCEKRINLYYLVNLGV
jgi:hypothetical protein